MSIEIKISKKPISYKIAMLYLNKRVEEVKKEVPKVDTKAEKPVSEKKYLIPIKKLLREILV